MADPISITGTAVGVLSFGLQVCGEIVSYCQAWKGFDEDIQNFARKADGLRVPLEVLRGLLASSKSTDVAISNNTEEKLRQIERVIRRLKESTDRFTKRGSGDAAAIRAQFKKATYPFRRNGLQEISSNLDCLQLTLHTLLHALSIQHAQTLITMHHETTQNVHEMKSSVREIQKLLFQSHPNSQNPNRHHSGCTAIVTDSSRVDFNQSSTGSGHPLLNFSRRNKATKKSYSHCMRISRLLIEFKISVTSGTAGLSIAPSLHLQPLRDRNSSRVLSIFASFRSRSLYYQSLGYDIEGLVDETIAEVQQLFNQNEAGPCDMFAFTDLTPFSILDYACACLLHNPAQRIKSSRLLQFLLDCGATSPAMSPLGSVYFCDLWTLDYQCTTRLMNIYGCGIQSPKSMAQKEGLRRFLCQDHDDLIVPDVVRAILRESEYDLTQAIKAKPAVINDRFDHCSLLDLAFGWPRGIQILLEAGADACAYRLNFVDGKEDTYHSVELLLRAGCKFDYDHIEDCTKGENGSAMRCLLIRELIQRLNGVWELAKCCLPAADLPRLFISDDEEGKNTIIYDSWTRQIYSSLLERGIVVEPSLQTPHVLDRRAYSSSVYHCPLFSAKTLEVLYHFGFRGVDEPDANGLLPLMSASRGLRYWGIMSSSQVSDRPTWLISKHADPNRIVPGSSSTVASHVVFDIVEWLEAMWFPYFGVPDDLFFEKWQLWKKIALGLGNLFDVTSSTPDECICACSPSGCNTSSLLLCRAFELVTSNTPFKPGSRNPGLWLREIVGFFIAWMRKDTKMCRAVTRSFTFDALGLRHVCCITHHDPDGVLRLCKRDRQEVDEILDEDRLGVEALKTLVAEFDAKFDELGLPIMDFMQGFWYTRMIEYLSAHDPYDQEHVVESRKLGVELQPEPWVVPDRVSLLIRPQVMGLDGP